MEGNVSLKEYIDSRINGVEKNIKDLRGMIEEHFRMNDKAVKLASDSLSLRLESMNEFREQMREERGGMATKDHLGLLEAKFDTRIKPLETAHAFSAGKMWMVMAIFAAVPTVLALIALFKG